MNNILKFKKLHPNAKIPARANSGDAGMDVYSIDDMKIEPRSDVLVGLGLACEFPSNYMLMNCNKSGRSTKLKLDKGAEVIDSGYRGEIHVHLFNHSDKVVLIPKGEKIGQLVLFPIWNGQPEEVTELSENTDRGTGGFGSSGLK
jgi:dUTP pyrophosphatase